MQQPSLRCHIGKRPIAVVAVEFVLPVIGDEEVFKAIVVVVSNAHPGAPARIEQPRLRSHIFECPIAIVVVETVARAGGNTLQLAPADDEDVHPPIVVVIEEGASTAHRLDDVFHSGVPP